MDDTARFTARAAVDRDLISGLFPIIGDRVSPNGMTDIVERISGEHYVRRSNGGVDDIRSLLDDARRRGDVATQTGMAYMLYMTTEQTAVTDPQNARYPDITVDRFEDVAGRALTTPSAAVR